MGTVRDDRVTSRRLDGPEGERRRTLASRRIGRREVGSHPCAPRFQAFVGALVLGRDMPLTDLGAAFGTRRVMFAAPGRCV